MDFKCEVEKSNFKRLCNKIIAVLLGGHAISLMLAFVTTTLVYAAVGNIIDKDSLMLICSVIVSILMCLSIIFLYRKLQTKEQIFALNKKISMKSFFLYFNSIHGGMHNN